MPTIGRRAPQRALKDTKIIGKSMKTARSAVWIDVPHDFEYGVNMFENGRS